MTQRQNIDTAKALTPVEQLTTIISQIIDANAEAVSTLDFSRADHREYLAGTIAHAMIDSSDLLVVDPVTCGDVERQIIDSALEEGCAARPN